MHCFYRYILHLNHKILENFYYGNLISLELLGHNIIITYHNSKYNKILIDETNVEYA